MISARRRELIRHYTFSESDLSIIRQRRVAGQSASPCRCYLRFPGVILGADEPPFPPLLRLVANQLKVGIGAGTSTGSGNRPDASTPVELCKRCSASSRSRLATTGRLSVADRAGHANRQGHRAGQSLDQASGGGSRSFARPQRRRAGRRSDCANRRLYDAFIEPLTDAHAAARRSASSAATTVQDDRLPGCANPRSNRTRGTCWNTRTWQGARPGIASGSRRLHQNRTGCSNRQ